MEHCVDGNPKVVSNMFLVHCISPTDARALDEATTTYAAMTAMDATPASARSAWG